MAQPVTTCDESAFMTSASMSHGELHPPPVPPLGQMHSLTIALTLSAKLCECFGCNRIHRKQFTTPRATSSTWNACVSLASISGPLSVWRVVSLPSASRCAVATKVEKYAELPKFTPVFRHFGTMLTRIKLPGMMLTCNANLYCQYAATSPRNLPLAGDGK